MCGSRYRSEVSPGCHQGGRNRCIPVPQDSIPYLSVHSPAISAYRRSDDADDGRWAFDSYATACVPYRSETLAACRCRTKFPQLSEIASCGPRS